MPEVKGTFQREADELATCLFAAMRSALATVLPHTRDLMQTKEGAQQTVDDLGVAIENCMAALAVGHGIEPLDDGLSEFAVHSETVIVHEDGIHEHIPAQKVLIQAGDAEEAAGRFHAANPATMTRKHNIVAVEKTNR